MYWYELDDARNVVAVLEALPPYDVRLWATQAEYDARVAATWNSLATKSYSPMWDEAKRCPRARDGSLRYRLDKDGVLVANASVADVDFDAALMEIDAATGVLSWR